MKINNSQGDITDISAEKRSAIHDLGTVGQAHDCNRRVGAVLKNATALHITKQISTVFYKL